MNQISYKQVIIRAPLSGRLNDYGQYGWRVAHIGNPMVNANGKVEYRVCLYREKTEHPVDPAHLR
jgi:hypothetical protein